MFWLLPTDGVGEWGIKLFLFTFKRRRVFAPFIFDPVNGNCPFQAPLLRGETDRQKDRQTDRPTDRQAETDGQMHKNEQKVRQIDK